MRSVGHSIVIFFLALHFTGASAQSPVLHLGFEDMPSTMSAQGISGKALHYGSSAIKRSPLVHGSPRLETAKGFSVMVWVNTDAESREEYDIVSALEKKRRGYNGWKIKVTASGSWEFVATKDSQVYKYTPTSLKQTIRDGGWHLLAASYSGEDSTFRFYYDGRLKAIYNAEKMSGFYQADTLVVGAAIDGEQYMGNGRWQNYWDTYNGQVDDLRMFDVAVSEELIAGEYERLKGPLRDLSTPVDDAKFTVCVFNIFHGGHEYGKEVGKRNLINMLREQDADAYLLIETYGSGAEIADQLDGYLYLISSNLSIISKRPFTELYRHKESFKSGGAQVRLAGGRLVNLFCVWLDWLPVFSSRDFTSGRTMEQYMKEEKARRGKDIDAILAQMKPQIRASPQIPVIVGGDFNSGSHLDHTEPTRKMHNGYVIPWPVSISMATSGFVDSYREVHPDPLLHPGITFSPHYDLWLKERIDYIYYKGNLKTKTSKVTDTHPACFPSDHAMVTTVFEF